MEFSRRHRIKREVKLVFPPELESGFRERVVAVLRARMAFGEGCGFKGKKRGRVLVESEFFNTLPNERPRVNRSVKKFRLDPMLESLFGVWGKVRFVYPRFSFLSSRIVQKRKQWLAQELALKDESELKIMLGPHWWFHFGKALGEVVLPPDFYRIGPANARRWDEIGLKAFARDCSAWPGEPNDDLMLRSRFNLFHDIGRRLYGSRSRQALEFAYGRMAEPAVHSSPKVDPQDLLDLYGTLASTRRNSSP